LGTFEQTNGTGSMANIQVRGTCDPNTYWSIRTKLQIPKIEIAAPYSDPDLICRKS
jgi:hypothetical protein